MPTAPSMSTSELVRSSRRETNRRRTVVSIVGWNALTAFGDLEQTWDALLNGRTISTHSRAAYDAPDDRAFGLAREVISASCFKNLPPDAALIIGTSKGPVEEWLHPPTSDNPSSGLSTAGLADIASRLASDLNITGPRLTLSAACASGLHALIRGAMMIQSGESTHVLVVATESSLHPLFIGSFQRLGVLAKPGEGARPFDESRKGFLMSEAAAAVLLQAAEIDGTDYDPPTVGGLIRLERFALGGDAFHLTGSDPDARLLKRLLNDVLDDRPVDLIHAHGTGTVHNDAVELAAIESVIEVQTSRPILWSHKAALGHSLGASGLLSVVLNCQCHREGIVPPNPNTTRPLATSRAIIPSTASRPSVRRSLAIATGFGGPTAVVSLMS